MKTALTKQIERIRRDIEIYKKHSENQHNPTIKERFLTKIKTLIEVEIMLTEGLKEEKKQIIEAYLIGFLEGESGKIGYKSGNDYYHETYQN